MSQNQDPIHLARQFEIIFTTHYSAVKYFAINLLKSEEDAEDIIQDVFAKLWTQPEVWLENKDIGQYIYDMTKNTTFNFIKRKRLEQSYQEQLSQKYLIEDLLKSEDTLDPIYYKEALLIIHRLRPTTETLMSQILPNHLRGMVYPMCASCKRRFVALYV